MRRHFVADVPMSSPMKSMGHLSRKAWQVPRLARMRSRGHQQLMVSPAAGTGGDATDEWHRGLGGRAQDV